MQDIVTADDFQAKTAERNLIERYALKSFQSYTRWMIMDRMDGRDGTVKEVSRITMTLIIIFCGLIFIKHWYTVSDYDYFQVVKAFMRTKTSIGGFHSFLITSSFWVLIIVSLVDMILNNYLNTSYTLKFLASFKIPFGAICAIGVLFIPYIGLTNIRLFWLFCYIILVICTRCSFALISRGSTLSGFIRKICKNPKLSERSMIDYYVRLAVSVLAFGMFVVMLVSMLIYGIQNRNVLTGSDDVMPVVFAVRYEAAVALMDNGEYENAMIEFLKLNDFEDSKAKVAECEQMLYQPKYNRAIALMNNEKYFQAINTFRAIYTYKDSPEQIEICNERLFDKAVALMDNGEYESAIEIFQSISLKDSYEKIEECWEALSYMLIGTWYGDAGSVLTLQTDGICYYVDGSGLEGEGTWNTDGGKYLYVNTSALSFELYAYLDEGFYTTSIYVQANADSWNNETFTR